MKSSKHLLLLTMLCVLTCKLSAQNILIQNATYLDVTIGQLKTGHILIQDGKIVSLDSKKSTTGENQVIDAKGKFIIPGLIDAHIHLFQSGGLYTRPDVVDLREVRDYNTEQAWLRDNADDLLKRYLRCGITTVVDVGGPMANFALRDQFKNSTSHPNLFLTGPLVSTYQPEEFKIDDAPIVKVNSSEEARELVRKQVPFQPDFIKIWYITLPQQSAESTYDIVAATIDESHKHNLKVAVHATELNTAKLAVHAGADFLVHSVDDEVDEDFIRLLKENDVTYIPTMIVHRKYIESLGQTFAPTQADFQFANPIPLGSILDVNHMQDNTTLNQYKGYAPQLKVILSEQETSRKKNLKTLHEAGINIATGTDAGNIGTQHASSYFEELDDMKASDLSNEAILKASSINAAKAIGQEKNLGSIEVGKMADLVFLNENPLEDLKHLRAVDLIIKGGQLISVDTLIQPSPEQLAQEQLNAYNARDIEAFLQPYSDSVKVYDYPDIFKYQGKERMRQGYASFFEETPNLHCELTKRMVLGNTVIDEERISGFDSGYSFEAIAIYKMAHGKIQEVRFISK